MYKAIGAEQFELARKTAAEARQLLNARDKLLFGGTGGASDSLPSVMWQQPVSLYRYVLDPTFEIVNTWRLHTFPFTGRYLGYAIDNGHNPLPLALRERYIELTTGLPQELILRPPRIMGEIGWEIDGGIVNEDVLMYQGHLTALYDCGAIDFLRSKPEIRILEIGAGYGGLAYGIWRFFSPNAFHILDLPESLVSSAVYLTLACGLNESGRAIYDGSTSTALADASKKFVFLPNYLLSDLEKAAPYDLVINTGSFGEMSREQVGKYAEVLVHLLKPDGVIYEANQDTWVPVSSILGRQFKRRSLGSLRSLWAHSDATLFAATRGHKKRPTPPRSVRSLVLKGLRRLQRVLEA